MITTARANASLGYELANVSYSFCPNGYYYLGLSSTNPSNNITEPTYTGYARQAIAYNTSSTGWTTPSSNTITNAGDITFPVVPSDASSVPDQTYWFLATTSTGTNSTMIYWGTLSPVRPMPAGSQIIIAAGNLKLQRVNPS